MLTKKCTYCRYQGFKLRVAKITDDLINAYTTYMHIGKALGMTSRDRDWFVMDIPKSQLEAIWTVSLDSYTYDTIRVKFGQLKVNHCIAIFDNYFNKFIENGEFVCYKGKIYRSISGTNHKKYFRLLSFDINSQSQGFIMEEPNKFYNQVAPAEIDHAFKSLTWCLYETKKFVVIDSCSDHKLKIQPWSHDTYSKSELNNLGFINSSKWIKADDAQSIWTLTEKMHDCDQFENENKILK